MTPNEQEVRQDLPDRVQTGLGWPESVSRETFALVGTTTGLGWPA